MLICKNPTGKEDGNIYNYILSTAFDNWYLIVSPLMDNGGEY